TQMEYSVREGRPAGAQDRNWTHAPDPRAPVIDQPSGGGRHALRGCAGVEERVRQASRGGAIANLDARPEFPAFGSAGTEASENGRGDALLVGAATGTRILVGRPGAERVVMVHRSELQPGSCRSCGTSYNEANPHEISVPLVVGWFLDGCDFRGRPDVGSELAIGTLGNAPGECSRQTTASE